ncbi:MAG: CAP domain-containing protein [bacterium]|nr:CAP domain-containing protein [bacterium]
MRTYLDHAHHLCRLAVIPHAENDYRPHILHPKRTVRYIAAFSVMKIVVLGLVVLLPASIFAAPEAVQMQEQELIRLVNDVRVASGADALTADARLAQSAYTKSADMAARQYFAHTNADGEGPDTFAARAGYPYSVIGENLAMGFVSAHEVVSAWQRSPTHAQNIRDALYEDTGVSVVGGTFHGEPTVFMAQHFGRERHNTTATTAIVLPPTESASAAVADKVEIDTTADESGKKMVALPVVTQPPFAIPEENVRVTTTPEQPTTQSTTLTWTRADNNITEVTAIAHIAGPIVGARAQVHGSDIPLFLRAETTDIYTGTANIDAPPEDIFRVVIPGTLSITSADGNTVEQSIPWASPLVARPSFGMKYAQAKTLLPQTFGPTLRASQFVFAIAFIIFALAWVTNLVIEIRRQHLDLLIPGGALVLLLGIFWLV